MRKAPTAVIATLFLFGLVVSQPLYAQSETPEKFVISARAGGVNAVTGGAMRGRRNTEWQQLTVKEDLVSGDMVRTGSDGRVEMLLNPGSYLRIAENSEFELANNSLENLEVRLVKGTAIVEVTGGDDTDFLINISTPHTRMAIVRRGLYRVNVLPGDATELIVRKGRVMLDSRTDVKGGHKMIFSGGGMPQIADLKSSDKVKDPFELWSEERGKTLAKANSKLTERTLMAFRSSFDNWLLGYGSYGVWLYRGSVGCYTFVPFNYGWGSPYGSYRTTFWSCGGCRRRVFRNWPTTATGTGSTVPTGTRINSIPNTRTSGSMPSSPRSMPGSRMEVPRGERVARP